MKASHLLLSISLFLTGMNAHAHFHQTKETKIAVHLGSQATYSGTWTTPQASKQIRVVNTVTAVDNKHNSVTYDQFVTLSGANENLLIPFINMGDFELNTSALSSDLEHQTKKIPLFSYGGVFNPNTDCDYDSITPDVINTPSGAFQSCRTVQVNPITQEVQFGELAAVPFRYISDKIIRTDGTTIELELNYYRWDDGVNLLFTPGGQGSIGVSN